MSAPLSNVAEFTVSEIAQAVKRTVEDRFGYVRVRGEISGFRGQHASGHAYFSLKDESATIDSVVWRTSWERLRFKPQEGLEVIATGRLTTYPKSSKYQLVIDSIEPAGAGALMALLEERRKKLAAEGLFERGRKRPLPYLPRVIGVITSPTGAVIRDILHRLEDRFPTRVVVWPVRVQGDTCADEVSAALDGFNAMAPGGPIPRPDLIIVARGGGSIEDLWGFNEESVVRAVAGSTIPVISAVGHETDTTLCDFAADHRAPTPTAAAEAAVPVRAELIGYVDDQGGRLRNGLRRGLGAQRDRMRAAAAGLPRPHDLLATARQRLDHAGDRLTAGLRHLGQVKAIALSRSAPRLMPRLLTQRASDYQRRIGESSRRVDLAVQRALERRQAALGALSARLSPTTLGAELRQARAVVGPLAARLHGAARRAVEDRAARLDTTAKLLDAFSYRAVLERGFALVTDEDGELVRSKSEVRPGQPLVVSLAGDEDFGVSVSGAPARRKRSRPPPRDDGNQGSLF